MRTIKQELALIGREVSKKGGERSKQSVWADLLELWVRMREREQTGWKLVVQADYVHQQALMESAHEVLPPAWTPRGNPALHLGEQRVAIKAEAAVDDHALVRGL